LKIRSQIGQNRPKSGAKIGPKENFFFSALKIDGKIEMKWYLASLSFTFWPSLTLDWAQKLIHQSKNLDKLGLYFQTD